MRHRKEPTITAATNDDYKAFLKLVEHIDALHRRRLPDRFRKPDGPARQRSFFDELLTNENILLLMAKIEDQAVGLVHAIHRETPAHTILVPRSYVIVDTLIVKPEFQRMGIGRLLMEQVERWASRIGAQHVELNVYQFNRGAIDFYALLGYETLTRWMVKKLK